MSITDADSAAVSFMQFMNLDAQDATIKTEDHDFTTLQLSELESNILDLYDRLQRLNLEMAHLNAQTTTPHIPFGTTVTESLLASSRKSLLEAQSRYQLKHNIVESVLIANPILKAVHLGSQPFASPVERDLLPLISARDSASESLTATSQKLLSTKETLQTAEIANIERSRENVELVQTMLELAEKAGTDRKEDVREERLRERIGMLEGEVKASRQRWRVMKGTASAVVAGSGVDWVRTEELRGLVLDGESDED